MIFNLGFANDAILSCFFLLFFLFLIFDLYFLIPSVITQIFIPAAELAIATGVSAKEAKAET